MKQNKNKIDYFKDYENKEDYFYKKYYNKNLKDVIKMIYDENEFKNNLDEDLNIIYKDEIKYILHSFISVDFDKIKYRPYLNTRNNLYYLLKSEKYDNMTLLTIYNIFIPMFSKSYFLAYMGYRSINNRTLLEYHFYDMKPEEKYNIMRHQLKYFIFLIKICCFMDVPLIDPSEEKIKQHWGSKFIFMNMIGLFSDDYDVDKAREKHLKDGVENDIKLLKNNKLFYFNDKLLKENEKVFYIDTYPLHDNFKVVWTPAFIIPEFERGKKRFIKSF